MTRPLPVAAKPEVPAAQAPLPKTEHDLRLAQLAALEGQLPKEPKAAASWLMKAAEERRAAGDFPR
ncbi:MAG: hypothetical protein QM702_12260 [Rubrivivax sp.]